MSAKREDLVKERLELQQEFEKYNAENGFDYQAYVVPPSGHFYEKYKSRLREIDDVLAPELKYHHCD